MGQARHDRRHGRKGVGLSRPPSLFIGPHFPSPDRDLRVVLHPRQAKAGAEHADIGLIGEDAPGEVVVLGHVADADHHEIVGIPGDEVALHHLRTTHHLALEILQQVLALALQRDRGEDDQGAPDLDRIHQRHVAGDDALLAQAPDPPVAGGRRDADPLRQRLVGDLVVLLQQGQDLAVDGVEGGGRLGRYIRKNLSSGSHIVLADF